jgi:hypothetical protein
VGIFGVTLTATDSFGASISDTFNLAIAGSNDNPNPEPTQTNTWDFVSIDYNLDGATDIMALNRSGTASGKTEVHIMDAATAINLGLCKPQRYCMRLMIPGTSVTAIATAMALAIS